MIFAEGKNKIVPNWKQMIIKEETNVIREEEDDISIPSFHYNLVHLNRLSCHIDCTSRVYGTFVCLFSIFSYHAYVVY